MKRQGAVTVHVVGRSDLQRDADSNVTLGGGVQCRCTNVSGDEAAGIASPSVYRQSVEPLIPGLFDGKSSTAIFLGEKFGGPSHNCYVTDGMLGTGTVSDIKETETDGGFTRLIRGLFKYLHSLVSTVKLTTPWEEEYALKVSLSGIYCGDGGSGEQQTLKTCDVLDKVKMSNPDPEFGGSHSLGAKYVSLPQIGAYTYAVNKLLGSDQLRETLQERKTSLVGTISVLQKSKGSVSHMVLADVLPEHSQHFETIIRRWMGGGNMGDLSDVFHPGSSLSLAVSTSYIPRENAKRLLDLANKVCGRTRPASWCEPPSGQMSRSSSTVSRTSTIPDAPPLSLMHEASSFSSRAGSTAGDEVPDIPLGGTDPQRPVSKLAAAARTLGQQGRVDKVSGAAVSHFANMMGEKKGSLLGADLGPFPSSDSVTGEEADWKDRAEKLANSIKLLQERLQKREGELLRLKTERDDAVKEKGALRRQIQEGQQGLKEYEEKIKSLQETIDKLKGELEDMRGFEEMAKKSDEECQILRRRLSDVKKDTDGANATEAEVDDLRRQLADTKQALEEACSDVENMASEMDEQITERANLEDRLAQLAASQGDGAQELANKQAELDRTMDLRDKELERQRNEITALQEALDANDPEMARLRDEHSDMQDRLHSAEAEASRLGGMMSQLTSDHSALKEEWDKLTGDNAKLRDELGSCQSKASAAQGEADALRAKLNALEQDATSDNAKLLKKQQEDQQLLAELQGKLRDLEQELKDKLFDAEVEARELAAKLKNAEGDQEQMKGELESLQAALKDARRSTDTEKQDLLYKLREAEQLAAQAKRDAQQDIANAEAKLDEANNALRAEERAHVADVEEGEKKLAHEQEANKRALQAEADRAKQLKEDYDAEARRLQEQFDRDLKRREMELEGEKARALDEAARAARDALDRAEADLKAKLAESNARLAELQREKDALQHQLDGERASGETKDDAWKRLQDELDELRAALERERREREAAEREMQRERDAAARDLRDAHHRKDDLERQLAAANARAERLATDLNEAQSAADAARLAAAEKERAALDELKAANNRLHQGQEEVRGLRKNLAQADEQLQEQRRRGEEQAAEVRDLQEQLKGKDRLADDIERQLRDLRNEIAALKRANQDLEAQRDGLDAELRDAKQRGLKGDALARDLEAELDKLRDQLKQLEADQIAQLEDHLRKEGNFAKELALTDQAQKRLRDEAAEGERLRKQLEAESLDAHKEAAALAVKLDEAERRLGSQTREGDELKKLEGDLMHRLKQAEAALAATEAELDEAKRSADAAQRRAQQAADALQSEADDLRADLAKAETEKQLLNDSLDTKESALAALRRGEAESFSAQRSADDRIAHLEQLLGEARAESSRNAAQAAELERRVAESEAQLSKRAGEVAALQRAADKQAKAVEDLQRDVERANQALENQAQDHRDALQAAEDRWRAKEAAALDAKRAAEARKRELEQELEKSHATIAGLRRDLAREASSGDEKLVQARAETAEMQRIADKLREDLAKARREKDDVLAKLAQMQRNVDAAEEAMRAAKLEAQAATAAADRVFDRIKLAETRAGAAEERASRASAEAEAARRDLDTARLEADKIVDEARAREADAHGGLQREKRQRALADSRAATAEDEIGKLREALDSAEKEGDALRHEGQEAVARERNLERKLAAAMAAAEEERSTADRQHEALADELRRQGVRLEQASAAKADAEDALLGEQSERNRLRMEMEAAKQQAATAGSDLERQKQMLEEARRRAAEMRLHQEALDADHAEELRRKEVEKAARQEDLLKERAGQRRAAEELANVHDELQRLQGEHADHQGQLAAAHRSLKEAQAQLADKERELVRARGAADSARHELDRESAQLKDQLREANERADRAGTEAETLRAGDHSLDMRQLEQRAKSMEEDCRKAKTALRAAERQLEDATRRADSNAERLACMKNELDEAEAQLSAAADTCDTILVSPQTAVATTPQGRTGQALHSVARKVAELTKDNSRTRDELVKADAALTELRVQREDLEGQVARATAKAEAEARQCASERASNAQIKDHLEGQIRDLDEQLQAERLAAEEASALALRATTQTEENTRAVEARLRAELSTAKSSLSAAEGKLRKAASEAADLEAQLQRAQLLAREQEEAGEEGIERAKRDFDLERERLELRIEAAEQKAKTAKEQQLRLQRDIEALAADLEAERDDKMRTLQQSEQVSATEAAMRGEMERLRAQLEAHRADNDAAAKREAEGIETITRLDNELSAALAAMRTMDLQASTEGRSKQRLEALLDFADAGMRSLGDDGRLGTVASPTREVRRPDRDQALAAMLRQTRVVVQATRPKAPLELCNDLSNLADRGGSPGQLAEWRGQAARTADAYPSFASYISNAVSAVDASLSPDASKRELSKVASVMHNYVSTLSGESAFPEATSSAPQLQAFERELSLVAMRPSFAPENFTQVTECAAAIDNPAVRRMLEQLQTRAEESSQPLHGVQGSLVGLCAEAAVLLGFAEPHLFLGPRHVEELVSRCTSLQSTHAGVAADLEPLVAALKQAHSTALGGHVDGRSAVDEAVRLFERVLRGDIAPARSGSGEGSLAYFWGADGKRRLQADLDAVESRIAHSEIEQKRLAQELQDREDEVESYRSLLAQAEQRTADADTKALARLRGQQLTTEEMRSELGRLAERVERANNEMQEARNAQQIAEAARWELEGRLKGSQNELRAFERNIERLQDEAEALRARLAEADDHAEAAERRQRERETASQRRGDVAAREVSALNEKLRALSAEHSELQRSQRNAEGEREAALRRLDALEAELRRTEGEWRDSVRRCEDLERQADATLADLTRASTDCTTAQAKARAAESEAADYKRRAELAEGQQFAAEDDRDDARRRAESAERVCRQLEAQLDKTRAALEGTEDRANTAERQAAERLKGLHAADELGTELTRITDRLAATQRELQSAREEMHGIEREKWGLEGALRDAGLDKTALQQQIERLESELENLRDKLRKESDLTDRIRKADAERAEALRRADVSLRDLEEVRNRQRAVEVERADLNERLIAAESEAADAKRKGDMIRHRVKSLEGEVEDLRHRLADEESRAEDLDSKLQSLETESAARISRTEAEAEELRKGLAAGGGTREQLASAQARITLLQDTEADLRSQVHALRSELADASRNAARAEDLRSRLGDTTRMLQEKEEGVADLEETRRMLEAELAGLRDAKTAAEQKARDTSRRADLLAKEVDGLRDKLKACEAEKGDALERAAAAEQARDDAQRRLSVSQHEVRSLQSELDHYMRGMKDANGQLDDAQSDALSSRAQLERVEAEVQELRTGMTAAAATRQQLGDCQRKLAQAEDEAMRLQAELRRMGGDAAEHARLSTSIDDYKQKLQRTDDTMASLEDRLQNAEDARLQAESEANTVKTQLRDTEGRLGQAHHDAEAAQREATTLRSKLDDKETELADLHQRVLVLERSREESRHAMEEAEKRVVHMEQVVDESRRAARDAERAADEARAELDSLRSLLQQAEGESADLRRSSYELVDLKQQLGDATRKLSAAESSEQELRSLQHRLETRLHEAEGDVEKAQREAAQSAELRVSLNDTRRKLLQANGQVEGLELARKEAESELLLIKEALLLTEQENDASQLESTNMRRELKDASSKTKAAEDECAALQAMLLDMEKRCEDFRRRAELGEAAAFRLEGALHSTADRTGTAEDRAGLAEKRAAELAEVNAMQQNEIKRIESLLHHTQRDAEAAKALRTQLGDADGRIMQLEEGGRTHEKTIARLKIQLEEAMKAAGLAGDLDAELHRASKELAKHEAHNAVGDSSRKRLEGDMQMLREAMKVAESRYREAQLRTSELEGLLQGQGQDHQRVVAALEKEADMLTQALEDERRESQRLLIEAGEHERNCIDLSDGVHRLQHQLEGRPQKATVHELEGVVARLESDMARAEEARASWEAEARALAGEFQQVDGICESLSHVEVAVQPLPLSLPSFASGGAETLLKVSHQSADMPGSLEHLACLVRNADPLNASELTRLRTLARDMALSSPDAIEQKVLDTCVERISALHRRLTRGDATDPCMMGAIAEALEGGVGLVQKDSGAKHAAQALEAVVGHIQNGNAQHCDWAALEADVQRANSEGASRCIADAVRSFASHAPNHNVLSSVAQGIRDGGWDLLTSLKKLSDGRLPVDAACKLLRSDNVLQTLARGPSYTSKRELSTLVAEYVECKLLLDPASARMMSAVQEAKRHDTGSWHHPTALRNVLDRAASTAAEASARTSLRVAGQRLGRCAHLHEALAVLSDGRCSPEVVDQLRTCKTDQASSGVAEVAAHVGQRLALLGSIGEEEAHAALLVIETAILTPPHAPHNVLRALRMLDQEQASERADRDGRFARDPRGMGDPEKLREHFSSLTDQRSQFVTVLQQLRDDMRSSAAQLYDVPLLQTALRRCGECIASVQKRASTHVSDLRKTGEGRLTGDSGEDRFRRAGATQVVHGWEFDGIAASLAAALGPEKAHPADQPPLLKHLREAEGLRTVPRLTLTELCEMHRTMPNTPALLAATQRLQSLKKRSDIGLFVDPWELQAIREALEYGLTQTPVLPEGAGRRESPERGGGATSPTLALDTMQMVAASAPEQSLPLRHDGQRRALRRSLKVIEERLKEKANDLAREKRSLLELQQQLRQQQEAVDREGAGHAGLRDRLRDTELQLSTARAELESTRAQARASHDEMAVLVQQARDGTDESRRMREGVELAGRQLAEVQAQMSALWKSMAPLVGLDPLAKPDPARLAATLRERIERGDDMADRLKAVVAAYIGTLDSSLISPRRLMDEGYVADVEVLLRVARQILDKLVSDVEGAQLIITQQNELLRKMRASVAQSAADITDLSGQVSPRRVVFRDDLPTSAVSTPVTYPSALKWAKPTAFPTAVTPVPLPDKLSPATSIRSSRLTSAASLAAVPSRPVAPLSLPPADFRPSSAAGSNTSRTRASVSRP